MNDFARLCAGQRAFSSRLMFSFACQKRTRNPSRAGSAGDVFLSVKRLALRAGQRQGGVFRLPPPYLWTPLSPQRVKGCSPLTNPSRKSKPKNASRFAKTGCGAQRPLRALSGTRVLLTAAPTAPPCIRRRRRSSLLRIFCASPIYGSADDFTFLLNFTP